MKVSIASCTNFYGTSSTSKNNPSKTSSQEELTKKCIDDAYREGNKLGFVTGAMVAALITSGACKLCENNTDKNILNDMQKTISTSDIKQIKIDNYNNTPCIILEDKNGDSDIYDISSGNIYMKIGDEVTEKD